MAGTSDIYNSQIAQLQTDLLYWQAYIEQTAAVIQTFNDTIDTMQTQMDLMQNTLDALIIRSEKLEEAITDLSAGISAMKPYVRLSTSGVEIASSTKSAYTKSIGVFTNQNTIYVYCAKSIDNVLFADTSIKAMGNSSVPFTSFSGSDTGVQKEIKALRTSKSGKFTLIFSPSSVLDSDAADAASLDVNITKKVEKSTYMLLDKSLPTTIKAAIDTGINSNTREKSLNDVTNTLYIDTTLSSVKTIAEKAASAVETVKPTSITTISTASNVTASVSKLAQLIATGSTTTKTSTATTSTVTQKVVPTVARSSSSTTVAKTLTTKTTTSSTKTAGKTISKNLR